MTKKSILLTVKWLKKNGVDTIYGMKIKDFIKGYRKQELYNVIFFVFVLLSALLILLTLNYKAIYTLITIGCLVVVEYVFLELKFDDKYRLLPVLHTMKKRNKDIVKCNVKISNNLLQVICKSKGDFNYFVNKKLSKVDIPLDGTYDINLITKINDKLSQIDKKNTLDKFIEICDERSSDDYQSLDLYFVQSKNKVKYITFHNKGEEVCQ